MKKIISGIGFTLLFGATLAMGQGGWLYTNWQATAKGTLVNSSNQLKLLGFSAGSNATVLIDTIQVSATDVPASGWTNTEPIFIRVYDNWFPTNRYSDGSTYVTATEYSYVNYTQYPTTMVFCSLPMAYPAGLGNWPVAGVHFTNNYSGFVTNYYTNTFTWREPVTNNITNMFTPITPIYEYSLSPSSSATLSSLNLICGKGGTVGLIQPQGSRLETNLVNFYIKYKFLFSPSRP